MKKSILIFLMYIMLLPLPLGAFADTSKSKTVPLKKEKRQETDKPTLPIGRRMPTSPVMSIINEEGISIDGADTQFNLYEVYDESGSCLISCPSKEDFLIFIFNTDEKVEICLYTDIFIFSGLWLP